MDDILHSIYYDPSNKGSFASVRKLYQEAKTKPGWKGTIKDVGKFLAKQSTYTRHRLGYVNFQRRRFFTAFTDYCWQLDLMDIRSLSRQNNGVKFLLCIIDTFSKYVWVKSLKSKNSAEIVQAFQSVLKESGRIPLTLFSDKGTEFVNKDFKQLTDKRGIIFYQAQDADVKAGIAERVIRTIKSRLYKYMYSKGTSRYIEALPDIVSSYNDSMHRSIGMAPSAVTPEKEAAIFKRLFPNYGNGKKMQPRFQLNDEVRIQMERGPFTKSYLPRYSEEVFVITRIIRDDPPVYKLRSKSNNEEILGSFYNDELVLTLPDVKV